MPTLRIPLEKVHWSIFCVIWNRWALACEQWHHSYTTLVLWLVIFSHSTIEECLCVIHGGNIPIAAVRQMAPCTSCALFFALTLWFTGQNHRPSPGWEELEPADFGGKHISKFLFAILLGLVNILCIVWSDPMFQDILLFAELVRWVGIYVLVSNWDLLIQLSCGSESLFCIFRFLMFLGPCFSSVKLVFLSLWVFENRSYNGGALTEQRCFTKVKWTGKVKRVSKWSFNNFLTCVLVNNIIK